MKETEKMVCPKQFLPWRKLFRILAVLLLGFTLVFVGLFLEALKFTGTSRHQIRNALDLPKELIPISNDKSNMTNASLSPVSVGNISEVDPLLPPRASAPSIASIPNTTFVYFIIPKCGSRTLFYLVSNLKDNNRWGEVSAFTKLVTEKRRDRTYMVQDYVDNATRPAFLYVDTSFVPLRKDPNLVYISLIRNPLERFLSAYYFEKSGDGIQGPGAGLNGKYGRDYFSHCQKSHRNDTCFGHWLGKTIHPRFCGVTNQCSQMARKTIERAKRIATQTFSVVGILEEFDKFLQLLEKRFPLHFAGIVDLYRDSATKEFMSKVKTKEKERPRPDIIELMKVDMKLDYEFYYYIKENFHKQLEEYNIQ